MAWELGGVKARTASAEPGGGIETVWGGGGGSIKWGVGLKGGLHGGGGEGRAHLVEVALLEPRLKATGEVGAGGA